MEAYVPGEQPSDMKYIKLNTNEFPYPPSPEVIKAVSEEEAKKLSLYPDPECKNLRCALAEKFSVTMENIFVSNGSDDILNFAFMAFGGDGIVFPDITYGFYKVFAELHGESYEEIPLDENFEIRKEDYMGKNKMIAIANPNAPTGISIGLSEIEEIVKANPDNVVLIDEAYVDFGGTSALRLTEKYENLLVVGTFSKSRALAGARLGFAVASKEIIKDLEKIKYSTNPYSINRISLAAGTAAVMSDSYYKEKCKEVSETREKAKELLKANGFTLTDSVANFIFVKKEGVSGEVIYKKLREKGILVRHFRGERIKEYNRITIGTKEEMEVLTNELINIAKEEEK